MDKQIQVTKTGEGTYKVIETVPETVSERQGDLKQIVTARAALALIVADMIDNHPLKKRLAEMDDEIQKAQAVGVKEVQAEVASAEEVAVEK